MRKFMDQNLIESQFHYKEQDPIYRGEPFDHEIAEGPTEERKIRDFFFCLLYIAFWVGLIIVAIIAFGEGQPHLLAAPFDSTGQQCGYSSGYKDFPYSYFNSNNISQFVCINECPETGLTTSSKCMFNNS
eukprot:GHVR01086152.1.p2 GENE.GHVR01086152.1~~GHVR01086152.1.p2  ORF type:complete len:130 (-),score=5.97 GHVR01086152.1:2333-2722(-)